MMKKTAKIIFHIDLNAFFATCAILKEPYLKNKVFVVGGQSSYARGVISTASYKARKYGINSGMSIVDALRLYPRLLVVPVDFNHYREMSNHFMSLLREYTDIMIEGSIDEAYLDVTKKSEEMHPIKIAKEIQERLMTLYKLPCSIGIAPTLFLAKMASDMKKPLGITILRKRDVEQKLYPLDVSKIYGIGKQTYPKLIQLGIHTIGDFMNLDYQSTILRVMSESSYLNYRNHVLGNSSNTIDMEQYKIPKSISAETTFNVDIMEEKFILEALIDQLNQSYRRLKNYQMLTKTIGIKLRNKAFDTITRSITLDQYTDDVTIIKDQVENLFETYYEVDNYRLVGVHLSNLILKSDVKLPFNLFTYEKFNA